MPIYRAKTPISYGHDGKRTKFAVGDILPEMPPESIVQLLKGKSIEAVEDTFIVGDGTAARGVAKALIDLAKPEGKEGQVPPSRNAQTDAGPGSGIFTLTDEGKTSPQDAADAPPTPDGSGKAPPSVSQKPTGKVAKTPAKAKDMPKAKAAGKGKDKAAKGTAAA